MGVSPDAPDPEFPCGRRALTIIVFVTEFSRDKIRGAFHCPVRRRSLSWNSAPSVTAVDHVSMQLGPHQAATVLLTRPT
jgi:hypothetical protein